MNELYKKYIPLFEKYGLEDWQQIATCWREPHRFYHTEEHLMDLIDQIALLYEQKEITEEEKEILLMVAYFHDIVYDPLADDNEQKSVEVFSKLTFEQATSEQIRQIILDTQHHQAQDKLSALFCALDMRIVTHGDFEALLSWEKKVFKEFQVFDYALYKIGRVSFLEDCIQKYPQNQHNLTCLIAYINAYVPKIGIYAGSFNPFHRGHLNILEKAEKVFDKVIIARGVNPEKTAAHEPELIHPTLKYRQTEDFEGLLTDYITEKETSANISLVRGLRNGDDLDYEVNQLRFMEDMKGDLKVVFIRCDKQFEHISSSALRNLEKIGKGFSQKYIP